MEQLSTILCAYFVTLQYGVQLYNDYRAAFVTQFKLAEPELSDGGQGVPKVQ